MYQPKTVLSGAILYLSSTLLGLPSLLVNAIHAPVDQSKPTIIIGGLGMLVLFALLGYKIYLGRNWARQTYAVLTILGLLVTFTAEQTGQHHYIVKYIFGVQTLLSIVALALFYMPASNSWFYQMRLKEHA